MESQATQDAESTDAHWTLDPPLDVLTVRQRAARTSPDYHKKIFYQNRAKVESIAILPANAAAESCVARERGQQPVFCTLVREENPWGRVAPGRWQFMVHGNQLLECDDAHATLLEVLAHKVWRGRHGSSRAGRGRGGVPVQVRLVFSETHELSFFIRARSNATSRLGRVAQKHSALLEQAEARQLVGPRYSVRLNPFPSEIYVRSERRTRYALYLDSRKVRKFRVQIEWRGVDREAVRALLIHSRPGCPTPTTYEFVLREGQDWLTLASDASKTLTDVLAHGVWVPREQVQNLTLEFPALDAATRSVDFQLRSRRSSLSPAANAHRTATSQQNAPPPAIASRQSSTEAVPSVKDERDHRMAASPAGFSAPAPVTAVVPDLALGAPAAFAMFQTAPRSLPFALLAALWQQQLQQQQRSAPAAAQFPVRGFSPQVMLPDPSAPPKKSALNTLERDAVDGLVQLCQSKPNTMAQFSLLGPPVEPAEGYSLSPAVGPLPTDPHMSIH